MSWVVGVAARGALRRSAVLVPAGCVLVAVMAGTSGLTALVTSALRGGQAVGSLTAFLVVTGAGLAAVALSVFSVVRATLAPAVATLRTLGAGAAAGRLLLVVLATLTALAALPVGAVASPLVEAGVRALLRASGYHGVPTGPPDRPLALAVGAAATLALAVIGAAACRGAADPDGAERAGRRLRPAAWVRPAAAVVVAAVAAGCAVRADAAGGAAIVGGALAAWGAATLAAGPVATGLNGVIGALPLRRGTWPVTLAARADRAARLTSAGTVATATLALYAAVAGAAAGAEGLSRAAVARALSADAVVASGPGGALLPEAGARDLCRRAGGACVGLVHVAPDQAWLTPPAVADAPTAAALLAGAGWHLPGPGFVTGPWPDLTVGTTPPWTGGSALVVLRPGATLPGAQPAREWAATAPSPTVIRGNGAADVLPMLSPLILLAALYAAAAAYTAQAGRAPVAARLTRLGAGPLAGAAGVGLGAGVVTAVAFALTAGVAALVDRTVRAAAAPWGLDITTATTVPPLTFAAAVPTACVITLLGLAGARAGRLVRR